MESCVSTIHIHPAEDHAQFEVEVFSSMHNHMHTLGKVD